MGDRIYKLTEVEFLQHEYESSDCDYKGKNIPSATYTEPTPSIASEQILSVRERAENYFHHMQSKEVSLISVESYII